MKQNNVSPSAEPLALTTLRKATLTLDSSLVSVDDDGLQEFIGNVVLVLSFDGLDNIFSLFTNALCESVYGDLDSFPSLIAVHGIVATNYSREFTVLFFLDEFEEILGVAGCRARCGVTTVTKEVDIRVRNADFFRSLEKRVEVVDVGVDTAVRDLAKD